jgi:hypothetical protein
MNGSRVQNGFMTTQRERATAEAQIRAALTRFRDTVASATPEQWAFRSAAGSWSMADVAEHVAISNRNIYALLSRKLLASRDQGLIPDVIDVEIPYLFYRGEEPRNIATPTGTWTDRDEAMRLLDDTFETLLSWCAGVTLDLRTTALAHPVFGRLDGIQWLQFTAAHTERHRAQVIGIRRHPAFPT